ncbi:MAG: hypothetical protein HYZ71_15860 [Deltaproteobacteria bacterium]|nr:hypothetical protein [Deltaproteobacteria bacterium]
MRKVNCSGAYSETEGVRVLLLLSLLTLPAEAAFRVYLLRVTQYDSFGNFVKHQSVMSTLDHLQYEHYHGGYRWSKVELIDTWYCPGDTAHRKLCDRPKVKDRVPASLERDKRTYLPYNRQPIIP